MSPALSKSADKAMNTKKSTWLHKILEDDWLNRLIEWILKSIILLLLAVLSKFLNWIEYYRIPWFKISVMALLCIWVVKEQQNLEQAWSGLAVSNTHDTEFAVMGSIFGSKSIVPQVKVQDITVKEDNSTKNPTSQIEVIKSDARPAQSSSKDEHIIDYINRFTQVAQAEKLKYNIPASIKMAQGILESNAGRSTLASRNNNHFGIKCMSRQCSKGHCTNHSDDHHKDFFRNYQSAWQGWRAHSELLMSERYRHLQEIDSRNYTAWAKGLQKAGYATDSLYAEKLTDIIERYNLWQLDLPMDEPI